MNALLTFAAVEAAALLLLVALILAAPEAVEDQRGFRVIGPSAWQKFRMRRSRAAVPINPRDHRPHLGGRSHA